VRDDKGHYITIDVASLSETVEKVKIKFREKEHIPVDSQRFIFLGKELQDGIHV
jgi:hypothetical protein